MRTICGMSCKRAAIVFNASSSGNHNQSPANSLSMGDQQKPNETEDGRSHVHPAGPVDTVCVMRNFSLGRIMQR